jgi:hypothetical protein
MNLEKVDWKFVLEGGRVCLERFSEAKTNEDERWSDGFCFSCMEKVFGQSCV